MRSRVFYGAWLSVVVACAPSVTPVEPRAAAPMPVSRTQTFSKRIESPRVAFADLFLRQEDIVDLQPYQSADKRDPKYDFIFSCLGGPGGTESALAEWGDSDGRATLWRLSDLRWSFDDDAAAEAFRKKTMTHFERKDFTVTPCDPVIGDACARVLSDHLTREGTPHAELGYLFRIGSIVAEIEGAEGPRVSTNRLSDDLVLPFARRAEQRIHASMRSRDHF